MNTISIAAYSVHAWMRRLIFGVTKDEIQPPSNANKDTLERLNAFIDAYIQRQQQQQQWLQQQQQQWFQQPEVILFTAMDAAIFTQELHAKMADDIVDCQCIMATCNTEPHVVHVTLHCSAWLFLWKAADFAKLHEYNLHVVIDEKLAARPENINNVLLRRIETVVAEFDENVTVYTEALANQFAKHMISEFKDEILGYCYGTKKEDEHFVSLGVHEHADWDTWTAVDFSKLQSKKLHVEIDFSFCYIEEQ